MKYLRAYNEAYTDIVSGGVLTDDEVEKINNYLIKTEIPDYWLKSFVKIYVHKGRYDMIFDSKKKLFAYDRRTFLKLDDLFIYIEQKYKELND